MLSSFCPLKVVSEDQEGLEMKFLCTSTSPHHIQVCTKERARERGREARRKERARVRPLREREASAGGHRKSDLRQPSWPPSKPCQGPERPQAVPKSTGRCARPRDPRFLVSLVAGYGSLPLPPPCPLHLAPPPGLPFPDGDVP